MCKTLFDPLQTKSQPPFHGFGTERSTSSPAKVAQIEHPGPAIKADDVQIDSKRALKIRGGKQMRHQAVQC